MVVADVARQAVSARDRCGPDFHYSVVVVRADTRPPPAPPASAVRRRAVGADASTIVSVNAGATSTDVVVSELTSTASSLRLSVVAVNCQGPAAEPTPFLTVDVHRRTSLTPSDDTAIRYVLPVLRMTSCFP